MEKQNPVEKPCVFDTHTHTHTHTPPFRRLLLTAFIIFMFSPFIGKGQEPLINNYHLEADVWSQSPTQANYYKRVANYSIPFGYDEPIDSNYFFTMKQCNKASLFIFDNISSIQHFMINYKFYKNGILYLEYNEPELLNGENNYGNYTNFSAGITPDFSLSEPGTYNLYVTKQVNSYDIPDTIGYFIIKVLADTSTPFALTINTPDTVCYKTNVCWSVSPNVYDSLSGDWGVNPYFRAGYEEPTNPFNPCAQALTLGNQTITVDVRDFCGRDTTLTKNFYVKYMSDFTLPTSVCPNQLFSVGEIFYCRYPNNPSSFLWNWGDGTTSNTQNASHSYSSSGTYTVSLTIGAYIGGQTQYSTMSKTIYVSQLPTVPSLTGTFTTCDNPSNYTITNPQTNTSYTWTSPYSTSITGSDTIKSIVWNMNTFPTLPSEGNLNSMPGYFTIIANNNGCVDTTEFKVWKCCSRDSKPTYSDTIVTSNFPDGQVYINGTIVIANSLTQTNTEFLMGPEAKIIVNPPYTFELNNLSIIRQGCRYMWDGVYVESPQSKVKFTNIRTICDAFNAINSRNGGNFEVVNSKFINNYISIKVTDYRPSSATNHPGTVTASNFIATETMLQPYNSQKAHTGIYVDNVYNLTIGSTAQNYNTFDNLFCGMQVYNSYVTVVKNRFQNIKSASSCSPGEVTDYSQLYCETAIHVAKKAVPYNPYDINQPLSPTANIGGATAAEGNTFINCDLAYNSYLTKQIIKNDSVISSKTGFSCRDVIYGGAISNNYFTANTSNIYINSTTPTVRGITIENNTINNIGTYGIRIFNCKSQGLVKTKVLNNSLYFTGPKICRGIYVANCDAITLQGNVVTNSGSIVTTTTTGKHMRGINIENSPNSLVKSNKFTKMGSGVYAEGMESGTQFQCNELSQNYYGFYFPNGLTVGTVYENQGTAANPNDNKWISDHPYTTAYRISGDAGSNIVSKQWFYKSNPYFNPNIIPSNPAYSFVTPVFSSSTALAPCDGAKGGNDELYTENIDSISTMEETIPENSNLAPQMRYLYMSMLYSYNSEQFIAETTQAEEGLYANIPLIAKINQLAQNDSTINKAIELNNAFAPINDMEIHRKFVNEVYLNYVVKGETPSSDLVDELYAIANLSPSIGGEAVHIARAILNYEPTTRNKQDFDIPAKLSLNDNIQWYPNPANDILNVASLETFVSGSKIELYDIIGRMVLSSSIDSESNIATISLKEIKQGLYLCVIKNGEEIISSSKISVIKQ